MQVLLFARTEIICQQFVNFGLGARRLPGAAYSAPI
jgi:hypothetical protein